MTSSVSRSQARTVRTSESTPRTPAAERTGSTRTTRSTQPDTSTRTAPGNSSRSSFSPTSRAASTGSLRPGARGEQVTSLQDKLRSSGFDPGRSDGVFGERTERAVRDFQRARGLTVDGIAGRRTLAALNSPDSMEPTRPTPNGGGVNGTASLNNQPNGRGMTTGSVTVNGNTYQFNSGSSRLFSVPEGTYRVTAHRNSRSEAAFSRDGVGFSFRLEDARRPNSDAMYDSRAGRDRTALRIHPDGGARGTAGCIGIVGDGDTMRRFRDDMNAELRRNGGSYTLRVQ